MTTDRDRVRLAGDFMDQRLFDPPKTGIVRGRVVKISALGNHEGHSPAYLCWDEQGTSTIEAIADVTIVDLNSLPPSTAQVAALFRALRPE